MQLLWLMNVVSGSFAEHLDGHIRDTFERADGRTFISDTSSKHCLANAAVLSVFVHTEFLLLAALGDVLLTFIYVHNKFNQQKELRLLNEDMQ